MINFNELRLSRYPCGPEGKSSIVAALQAHCLIDDRGDILNETSQTGCKTNKSQGRWDKDLSYLAVVEDCGWAWPSSFVGTGSRCMDSMAPASLWSRSGCRPLRCTALPRLCTEGPRLWYFFWQRGKHPTYEVGNSPLLNFMGLDGIYMDKPPVSIHW